MASLCGCNNASTRKQGFAYLLVQLLLSALYFFPSVLSVMVPSEMASHLDVSFPSLHPFPAEVAWADSTEMLEGVFGDLMSKNDLFFRFVFNRENHSQLNMRFRDEDGIIEAGFQYYTHTGLWQYAMLSFNQKLFLDAFGGYKTSSSRVDFRKINQSLLQSYVGSVDGRRTGDRDVRIITNHLFPNKVEDNDVFKSIFCSYVDGKTMMKLPILSHGKWRFNYDPGVLRRMQNWGITDRLQRLQIERVFEISNKSFYDFITEDDVYKHDERRKSTENHAIKCPAEIRLNSASTARTNIDTQARNIDAGPRL